MKVIFTCTVILSCFFSFSQTAAEANKWFEKYEYSKAAAIFDNVAQKQSLKIEDYRRWCYTLYITGDYEKCFALADSIVRRKDTPAFFYYLHGYTAMGIKEYAAAKLSFEKYRMLDDEYNVDELIKSCEQIPTWKIEDNLLNRLAKNNSDKSDFSGPIYKDGYINFYEGGRDSVGNLIVGMSLENAELMVMRPYYIENGNAPMEILVSDSIKDAALTSFADDKTNGKVYVTLSKPLKTNATDRAPHIYEGQLQNNLISNLKLWEFSGYEDTTATAHATINDSGNILVFSKLGDNTKGSDLYMSTKAGSNWTKPQPISKLNTDMDEMYPMFMGDTLLSFSSDGKVGYGGLDVFLATMNGNEVTSVNHLKAPINSFKDDFNFVYFAGADSARYSSNRSTGLGDDDIYIIKFKNVDKIEEPIPDSIDFYAFVDNWVDPIVYFDFDKFDLTKDVGKLKDLIVFLDKHPKSTVNIEGHTDRRGTNYYNMVLGEKRASAIRKELMKRGVRGEQISTISKGRTEPQQGCANGCTEAQHALNRVGIIRLKVK
jgi:hypothetical protein